MYCNDIIARKARTVVSMMKNKSKKIRPFREVSEIAPLLTKTGPIDYNGTTNGKPDGVLLYPNIDNLDVIQETNELGKVRFINLFGYLF